MSQHLKKGCPLPISIIAEERARLGRKAKELFWGYTYKERQAIVTERTILYMDKFRDQTTLDESLGPFPIELIRDGSVKQCDFCLTYYPAEDLTKVIDSNDEMGLCCKNCLEGP